MNFNKIKKPAILLDEAKCRRNIRVMADKARSSGVVFRPHFKTHQTTEIGRWFREEGVKQITVSSVTMAKHFAGDGWDDITIAFPLNLREADDAEKLTESINLNILISDIQQATQLRNRTNFHAGYFIKIDTGNNRSGVEWDDQKQIMRILDEMNFNHSLRFMGFLTHSGHTYKSKSVNNIIDIHNDTLTKLSSLKSLSAEIKVLSTGDTPSCSIIDNFKGFDEIRPGNFVFYDLTQFLLGSCNFDQIAITVACPVVEKNIKRNEIIIYGGGVHLSKECVGTVEGQIVFGKAVLLQENGWVHLSENDYVRSVSQEHGIISASDELFNRLSIGDLVGIIPVHSCMTADLLRKYQTFDDKILSGFSPK
jgi:D-serine deaminase-like pyridoxal phosphate-dependent protein